MTVAFLRGFGFDEEIVERMVYGDLKEDQLIPVGVNHKTSSRFVQQTLGTEWGRVQIDTDLWVSIAIAKAESLLSKGVNVVIDDLRFPNEHAALYEYGASLWRVERPGNKNTTSHPSEGLCERLRFDVTIRNEFDIENLNNIVHYIMET